ncbi:MAG: LamG domain-containing protein [Candidatus Poribacteria bacterium]|nr:LamG domain-containing protein [Candidatus Poribacteria bacterium]
MKTVTLIITLLFSSIFITLPVLSVEKGLVAYWGFNEGKGDTTEDLTGNGHNGKLMGDPQWTKDGYFGGALEFDQAGDEVNVEFHADLNSEAFTVSAWANVEPGSAGHRAVISSRDEPPVSGYIIYAEPGNKWQFWTGVGNRWSPITGPAINLGKWDHLAGTYADGKQKFYVNGELVGEVDAEPVLNTKQEFLIGAGANERANHEYLFKGKIDEVRLYNRDLSEDEIASVMDAETAADVYASGKLAMTWATLKIQ